jgi:hypothetical protein
VTSHRPRLTRRAALTGLGAAGAAGFLRGAVAGAQSKKTPQRLLLIHRPCGTLPDKWWPVGDDVVGWTASSILAPFERLRNDMVVLKGVDCPRNQNWLGDKNGAGMIAMMSPPPFDTYPDNPHVWPVLPGYTQAQQEDTNAKFFTAPDQTIDQLFLQKIPALQGTPIPSMQLTSSTESADVTRDCCMRAVSYAKGPTDALARPLWPEARPQVVWQNLFGRGLDPDAASRALDKSLGDFLRADLSQLKARLPSSEVYKIAQHLESLRVLDAELASKQCMPPTLGPLPTPPDGVSLLDGQYEETCKQHMQLIRAAFQCDITRVISFTYGYGNSGIHFDKVLPAGTIENTGTHYDIVNGGGTDWAQAEEAIELFYSQMTANLLLDLQGTPETNGDGSLLDNTLVVYWNNCHDGNSKGTQDIPLLLFGGKFLKLQGGKYLQFPRRFMSDLWVETAQAWGYAEMTSYGAPMWNTGRMPGIYG